MIDREQILRRFEARLDTALAAESAPPGIPAELLAGDDGEVAEATVDRYRMWSALTALTQEVKLQGRSFKQLSDTVAQQNEGRNRKEILDGLLDLRERLLRGVEAAGSREKSREKVEPIFWDRIFSKRWARIRHSLDVVEAMEQGYRLTLKSVDELLAQFEVRAIECKGEAFDPRCMSAVDVEETLDAAEGTVLTVYRTGYEMNGAVYRPAQVRVARCPKGVATNE